MRQHDVFFKVGLVDMDHQEKKFRSSMFCHRAQCAQSSKIQVQVALVSGLCHLHQFPFPALVIKPPLFFLPRSFPPLLTKSFPKTPNIFLFLQLNFSFPPLTKYLPIPKIFLLRSPFPPPIRDINYHQERFDDNHYNGLV